QQQDYDACGGEEHHRPGGERDQQHRPPGTGRRGRRRSPRRHEGGRRRLLRGCLLRRRAGRPVGGRGSGRFRLGGELPGPRPRGGRGGLRFRRRAPRGDRGPLPRRLRVVAGLGALLVRLPAGRREDDRLRRVAPDERSGDVGGGDRGVGSTGHAVGDGGRRLTGRRVLKGHVQVVLGRGLLGVVLREVLERRPGVEGGLRGCVDGGRLGIRRGGSGSGGPAGDAELGGRLVVRGNVPGLLAAQLV